MNEFDVVNLNKQMFQLTIQLLKSTWPLILFAIVASVTIRWTEKNIQEKSIKFFVRKHKIEIYTGIFGIVGYVISYLFIGQPNITLLMNVVITITVISLVIYSKTKDRDFYFISLLNDLERYEWIGQGTFQFNRNEKSFEITNSHSGYIYPRCLNWSDYYTNFEFKIINKSLGVILRATNLSNLVMLQIFDEGIKAHIRVNGFWQSWDMHSTHLKFSHRLNLDQWYEFSAYCDKNSIKVVISENDLENKTVFDRSWSIPTGSINFEIKNGDEISGTMPFSINLEFGTLGFRNHGDERALVKNLFNELPRGRAPRYLAVSKMLCFKKTLVVLHGSVRSCYSAFRCNFLSLLHFRIAPQYWHSSPMSIDSLPKVSSLFQD